MVTPQFLFKKVMPMIFEVNNIAEDILEERDGKDHLKKIGDDRLSKIERNYNPTVKIMRKVKETLQ